MYEKILNDPLVFGPEIGSEARNILTGLLTRDPTQRLGVNGAEEIRKHPFFGKHIDFKKLSQKKIHPPFKPSVASPVVEHSSFVDPCVLLTQDSFRMYQISILCLRRRLPSIVSSRIRICPRLFRHSSLVRIYRPEPENTRTLMFEPRVLLQRH